MIDGLFLCVEQVTGSETRELIVCCEAKSIRDDIVEEQIVRQVQALARQSTVTQQHFLPIAIKAIGRSEIFIVEFDVVAKADAAALDALIPMSQAIYELVPLVPGIGE